jgi:hypothetical protein
MVPTMRPLQKTSPFQPSSSGHVELDGEQPRPWLQLGAPAGRASGRCPPTRGRAGPIAHLAPAFASPPGPLPWMRAQISSKGAGSTARAAACGRPDPRCAPRARRASRRAAVRIDVDDLGGRLGVRIRDDHAQDGIALGDGPAPVERRGHAAAQEPPGPIAVRVPPTIVGAARLLTLLVLGLEMGVVVVLRVVVDRGHGRLEPARECKRNLSR